MVTKLIAVLLIFFFTAVIAVTVWTSIRLYKLGLLAGFLQGKWLPGLLTSAFIIQFIINGVALLREAEWAVPATQYTIYLWLVYLWLYGLRSIMGMIALLKWEKAKSLSQFAGRSRLFDELLEKSMAWSRQGVPSATEAPDEGHAVSDSPWENLINDEEWFQEVFPYAVRKKIRRKVTGLVVQTVVLVIMLVLLR